MTLAFVLLNCRLDSTKAVLDEIRRIVEVTEANIISGTYDMIVKVEADSVEEVKRAVMNIRRIEGVSSSLTLVQSTPWR